MPIYTFVCECGNEKELIRSIDNRNVPALCECGKLFKRKIEAPSFKLDGCDPAYPTAYDKWEADRNRRIKQERKATGQS